MYSTPKRRQPREAATAMAAAELKSSSWTSSAEPALLCSPAVSMSWTNNRKRFLCDYFPLKHFQKDREALIILMTQAESTKTVKLAATPVELMSPWFCNNCCIILQHKIQLAYVRHSCVPALGPAPESQKPTGLSVSQLGGRQTGSQQSVAWCEHAELVGNGNRSGFSRRSEAGGNPRFAVVIWCACLSCLLFTWHKAEPGWCTEQIGIKKVLC